MRRELTLSEVSGILRAMASSAREPYAGGGSNYFVEQSGAQMAPVYRELTLEKVDPEDGKEGVRSCTLVADKPPPLPPLAP